MLSKIQSEMRTLADPDIAAVSMRFFKTGPGQYGEGDRFRGIRVPVLRKLAKKYRSVSFGDLEKLLHSAFHEERLLALLILVQQYTGGDGAERKRIYRLYLDNTSYINNWDLVDTSAEHIVGAHLENKSRSPLTRLARSEMLWERRIAIIATFRYIKNNDFGETLRIGKLLLKDTEDLIHKAVGWMLREVGKLDRAAEETFLKAHYHDMPRTMLRYAIERFPEPLRKAYLKGHV